MEDMVAGPGAPLGKVLELVDRCEAYVGIFAWRYGYIPQPTPGLPLPSGSDPGTTSITHYEYLRAKEMGVPILAFLLDEKAPLSPRFIDGFETAMPDSPANTIAIRALRSELQAEKVVSWFTSPSDLEARVAAAVTLVGLGRQVDVRPAVSIGGLAGDDSVFDSGGEEIAQAITAASVRQRVFKIDIETTWWSTRLFLIAVLAERLSNVRRVVIVRSYVPDGLLGDHLDPTALPIDKPGDVIEWQATFVGMLSTRSIRRIIGEMHPAFARFEEWVAKQPKDDHVDLAETSRRYLREGWPRALNRRNATPEQAESEIKVDLTTDRLHRWFGDLMLDQAVEVNDLRRASVVDLMRLLDYPNDFVPVLSGRRQDLDEPTGFVDVVDKAALTARLARSYLHELKERARIN